MRWIPALIGALSFLSALPTAAQTPRPIAASVTGPILEASRNFIMIAGPEGITGVDTSGALLRVDDQISPRFRGLYTLTATSIAATRTSPLKPREVVLHLPAALRARFGGILTEIRKQQCRHNLAQIENSRKTWLRLHPNSGDTPNFLEVSELTAGWDQTRCSAGGKYVVNSRSAPSRCTVPGHSMAGAGKKNDLLVALPDLPNLDRSQRQLHGTVNGDPLRAPVFVLISPSRAYLVTRSPNTKITFKTDDTATPNGWTASLTGAPKGPVFQCTGITLGLPAGLRAQIANRFQGEQRDACRATLRQLEAAKEQWALDLGKPETARPTFKDLAGSGRYLRRLPRCPSGGTYQLGTLLEDPRCSVQGHRLPQN